MHDASARVGGGSPEAPGERGSAWLPLCVFAYGAALSAVFAFFIYWRQTTIVASVDLNGFGLIARKLAQGEGFTLGYGPTIRRGPFYPFFGAALLKLFGDTREGLPDLIVFRPLLIANCLLFGASCVLAWSIARRLFGPRAGLVAAAICPLIPQSLRYVGMAEVETLMGLCNVMLAWSGLRLVARPTLGAGVLFGFAAAAATLTKPVILLYPVGFLACALWYWRKAGRERREVLRVAAVVLVCFGVALAPWCLRNMAVTRGQFKGISSNGPGEFLRGYVNAQPKYYLLKQDFGGAEPEPIKWDPEASNFEERILAREGVPLYRYNWVDGSYLIAPEPPPGVSSAMLELEKDRIEGAEMKRRLLHEPFGFVAKFLVQIWTYWYIVETRKKSLFVGAIAFGLLALAVAGVMRARRDRVLVWPVVAVIVYNNAFYAAILAFARYSMPVFPTLVSLAAGGVCLLLERMFRRAGGPARGELA